MGGLDAQGARVPDAQPHPERRGGQGDDARQRPGMDRRRALADRRPRRALARQPRRSPRRRAGLAPRSIRIAPRAGSRTSAGKVSGVITEKGVIRTQAVLLAGGAWSGLFCRRHGLRLAQASVKSTSSSTMEAPEVTGGGLSMPDVTIRRRLDGGYTVGLGGRGLLELSPQGLMHARQFWPTFKKRRWALSFTHRPLVLRRAGGPRALVVRRRLAFRAPSHARSRRGPEAGPARH